MADGDHRLHRSMQDVPSIEDGGMSDVTVPSFEPPQMPQQASAQAEATPAEAEPAQHGSGASHLSRNEVAAINVDRQFYVSDVPSPYLSSKQAQEDLRTSRRRFSVIASVLVTILVLAVIAGVVWIILNSMRNDTPTDVQHYETVSIERGEFLDAVSGSALTRPTREEIVYSGVSGTVTQVNVHDGDTVDEGTPLMQLENGTVNDAFQKAQGALDEAHATVDEKNQQLTEANNRVTEAQNSLNALSQGNASTAALTNAQTVLTNAQTEAATAQTELDEANQTLVTIQETYDRARAQQDSLTVRAPISGTVSELAPNLEGTSISGAVRLCLISDTSEYCVSVEIPMDERQRVFVGQEVRLSFPSAPDLHMNSEIRSFEDADGRYCAVVPLSAYDARVTKGIAVETNIVVQSIPDSYIVPPEAIHLGEGGVVYINVLLDPTRGIHTEVPVTLVAASKTQAAIAAENIQVGNSVIIGTPEAEEA